jgi:hypothetical protein
VPPRDRRKESRDTHRRTVALVKGLSRRSRTASRGLGTVNLIRAPGPNGYLSH